MYQDLEAFVRASHEVIMFEVEHERDSRILLYLQNATDKVDCLDMAMFNRLSNSEQQAHRDSAAELVGYISFLVALRKAKAAVFTTMGVRTHADGSEQVGVITVGADQGPGHGLRLFSEFGAAQEGSRWQWLGEPELEIIVPPATSGIVGTLIASEEVYAERVADIMAANPDATIEQLEKSITDYLTVALPPMKGKVLN